MTDQSPAPEFDDFWSASELSRLTRMRFAERMAAYVPMQRQIDQWARPTAAEPADRLDGALAELLARRRSIRRFSARPIDDHDLGRLLSVLAGAEADRGYPSAGALYAIRAICVVFDRDRRRARVLQHNPIDHTLTAIGDAPGWAELIDDLGGHDAETPPGAVIGLFADTRTLLEKYGERGGRFALIEAGAVLQTLSLAAAELGLVGYPAGGASDRRMLGLAGLDAAAARYVTSYFVGHPG